MIIEDSFWASLNNGYFCLPYFLSAVKKQILSALRRYLKV